MHNSKHRILPAVIAASMIMTMLCSCTIDLPDSKVPTGLPEITSTVSTTAESTTETTVETIETTTETTETSTVAETYETAVESTGIDTDYVRVVAGVDPEMMNVDYWIDEDDNIILMNKEEIKAFNYENRAVNRASDGETVFPYLDEFGETLDGDILRVFLNENADSIPSYPPRFYVDGYRTNYAYWQNLIDLSNIEGVEDVIEVKFGYSVKRMTLRLFPTEDQVYDGPDDKYFDGMLYAECMPYMPCVVLHESIDGDYLYVVFDSYGAWVRKDAIALCESREDWVARQNPDQWLVVTAREIRLGNDPHSEATTNLVLPMGTQMELVPADEAPEIINQRTTYGNYVVKVPTRGSDGYIDDEYVLIPVSDDVHVGYLPYTPANIVHQAFKLLGDRYGWGGDLQANDCTGITREIYRCFGILLPRVGQSSCTGVYKADMSGMDEDEKLEVISKLTPGSLIAMPGHMMIYLGTDDGIPYVISAVGTFVEPEPGSTEKIHPETVIITSLYVRNSSLRTWLDASVVAMTVKPEK